MKHKVTVALVILICLTACTGAFAQDEEGPGRWSLEKAQQWYQQQPWMVGCNYIPATAINQLEMWQKETFDPGTIEKELDWASFHDIYRVDGTPYPNEDIEFIKKMTGK